MRALDIERVPARQERVDLEAPRHEQHIREDVGLDLGNIDRLGLLVDAAFHAVVANTVAGTGAHRVIDDHQGQGADIIALALDQMHFGNLFAQRATGEGYAQRIDLVMILRRRVLRHPLVTYALGAGVGVTLVAVDAVVDLVLNLALAGAMIGQGEAVATAVLAFRGHPGVVVVVFGGIMVHEIVEIGLRWCLEAEPAADLSV